ncbi:MAG TPA: creatininase family protein [archaeon]|nr:creatininase family protein [archaeon]
MFEKQFSSAHKSFIRRASFFLSLYAIIVLAGKPQAASGQGKEAPESLSGERAGKIERRYAMLYGDELYELIKERPLSWLPLGILEKHGAHLPWGLDGLKAYEVCLYLSERLGGVVLPANHLTGVHGDRREDQTETEFREFHRSVGDFMYREQTFRAFLDETFEGLSNIGFKVIVAYTGHYPEIQTIILREAAEAYTATGRATVIPFWEPLACGGGDHGGKWETSIYMALVPDGVRLDAIRDEKTGKAGYYRGQPVLKDTSLDLGRKALGMIEAYLTREVDRALNTN